MGGGASEWRVYRKQTVEEGGSARFGDRLETEKAEGWEEGVERNGGDDGGDLMVAGIWWWRGSDGGGDLVVAGI